MIRSLPTGPITHLLEAFDSLGQLKKQVAPRFATLTQREIEILSLVAQGLPNRKIAASLGIARVTVQNHRASIRQKLGITSELDYLKIALAYDLLEL